MSKIRLAALLFTTAVCAAPAHAGLIGVKSVLITNATNNFLQVTEFQAFQTGTGNNVALASAGALATTTSGTWDANSTPGKAIDGMFSNQNFPNMYHNANNTVGNLTVTLGAVNELDSFTIYGRSDCCSARDIYNVAFYGMNGNLLYTASNVNATGASHMASVNLPNTRVPEPGSLALLGVGLLGLAGRKARRSRAG